jgi:Lrp/AsnC family leucine-responsive transcriptional regulator
LRIPISKLLLDRRNVELLRLLTEDPRRSVSELARRIDMSTPAVRERLQRLEEAGVVQGCRLELDARSLGYPILAFIRVRPSPGTLPKIIALAQNLPQVSEAYRITGEDCFILKVHLDGLDNLDLILDQFLVFGQTTTSIVQSVAVAPRGPPLPEAPV